MLNAGAQDNGSTGAGEPSASDVARIQGGGLVQIILSSLDPMTFALFLNDRAVMQADVESLLVDIATPESEDASPRARATLGQYVKAVTGERSVQTIELFPCTLELVALGRRVLVTCQQIDNLDGLWVTIGLKPDGTGSDLSGIQALRILVTDGLLDAKLTWTDGRSEDLLAPAPAAPGRSAPK